MRGRGRKGQRKGGRKEGWTGGERRGGKRPNFCGAQVARAPRVWWPYPLDTQYRGVSPGPGPRSKDSKTLKK